jgi:hypothetical protein
MSTWLNNLNFSKGAFRIWIVLSVCWMVFNIFSDLHWWARATGSYFYMVKEGKLDQLEFNAITHRACQHAVVINYKTMSDKYLGECRKVPPGEKPNLLDKVCFGTQVDRLIAPENILKSYDLEKFAKKYTQLMKVTATRKLSQGNFDLNAHCELMATISEDRQHDVGRLGNTFLLPILVLLLGAIVKWIIAGFLHRRAS